MRARCATRLVVSVNGSAIACPTSTRSPGRTSFVQSRSAAATRFMPESGLSALRPIGNGKHGVGRLERVGPDDLALTLEHLNEQPLDAGLQPSLRLDLEMAEHRVGLVGREEIAQLVLVEAAPPPHGLFPPRRAPAN